MTNRKPMNSSRRRVLAGGSAYAALSVLGFPAALRAQTGCRSRKFRPRGFAQ